MDISYNHLLKHINKPLTVEQVTAGFTQMGVEVESIKSQSDDKILALEITPNRPDLYCYRGLARELSAALKLDQRELYAIKQHELVITADHVSNQLADRTGCQRFFLREIHGITVKESPDFIKTVLESSGIRPKNNIVDFVNYVMLEMGHPLHACDRDCLSGSIVIRQAKNKESVDCLDGVARTLSSDDMIISDSNDHPIGIAGIIGSQYAAIKPSTKNIYLECAYFDPLKVRTTSKRLGITTDSSRRFELGADPTTNEEAIERVTDLILTHAGGKVIQTFCLDDFSEKARQLTLPQGYLERYLGITIPTTFCMQALTELGFNPILEGDDIKVTVPSWRRHDIKYPLCLVEEIAKVYDYNKIPNAFPYAEITVREKPLWQQVKTTAEQFFIGQGFNQAINFSFLSKEALTAFNPAPDDPLLAYITIAKPLNEQYTILRTSQLPSLLGNYAYNKDQGIDAMKLFEIGRVFFKTKNGYEEKKRLSGLIAGPLHANTWQEKHRSCDVYDAKSLMFACLDRVGINLSELVTEAGVCPLFHPNKTAHLRINDQSLGWFGELNPRVIPKKTKHALIGFELDFEVIQRAITAPVSRFKPDSKFPSVYRDLSFACPLGFSSERIINKIHAVAGKWVKQVTLVDVYQGEPLTKGFESLSFAIEFNSEEETLTSDALTPLIDKIIGELTTENNITLR